MKNRTSIWVSKDTWRKLHGLKKLGQTMDELVNELIDTQVRENERVI